MKSSQWKQLFGENDIGLAILKVKKQASKIIDFSFLEINETMLGFWGLNRSHVLKKAGRAVFNDFFDEWELWKQFCEVVNTKTQKQFKGYSAFSKIYYFARASSIKKNQVIICYQEISHQLSDHDYEESGEMSLIVRNDYQIAYASPGVVSLLGYSVEEIKQKSIFNLIAVSSLTLFMQLFEDDHGHEDEKPFTLEVEMIHKNQTSLLTSHKITYLRNASGKVRGLIAHIQLLKKNPSSPGHFFSNEEFFKSIFNTTTAALFVIDLEGNIKFCNLICRRLLGYERESDLLGKNAHLLFHHHNVLNQIIPVEECGITQVFKTKAGFYSDKEVFWRKNRTSFSVEVFAHPLFQQGQITGVVVTFFDITRRKAVEKQLKESVHSHSVLLSNFPGMAYKCNFDRNWTMQFVSEGCFELTGHRPENIINNRDLSFNELIAPEFQEHLWQVWGDAVKNRQAVREEFVIVTATGERKWVLEQGQPVYNEMGFVESLEGLILDISEQKSKQIEIQYMSEHDMLTGLYNRGYFDKERARLDHLQYLPLSIIVADINGLKLTNDAFGHDEGDYLIKRTAEIIKTSVREDDVVARTGGDEFTVLLPNTDSETAYYYLKKIQDRCDKDKSNTLGKGSIISLSLGFATKESVTESISNVQKTAEDFMYKRKLLERNSLHSSFVSSITATMFEKSQETEAHAERMRLLSERVGKKLGLNQKGLDELSLLATLHDIGKVGIDSNILNKPGKLNATEWEEIKKHPGIGYRITKASPELSSIAEYVLSHHEKWDGSGYPQGLKGQEIPLLSRIISIVDAFDAMTQERSYRPTKTTEEALAEIKACAGTQFDPYLAALFIELMEEDA